jgi:cytochrome c oxidase assembly protein subunit 15
VSANSGADPRPQPLGPSRNSSSCYRPWRHRLALLTVGATLCLIFAGGLVTSTGSALAVPDWPLSYGMLMPPMVGGVFYEHGHRMLASGVGFLTLALAVWTALDEPRRGVRRLAWAGLATVVAQGVLGGLTVLYLLPTPVSVAHACLAQTFFCITIALAYAMSGEWLAACEPGADTASLRNAALGATVVVWLQLLVGAVMRHMGAGLAIPDFPLAFGRLIPRFESAAIAVHFAHRLGALLVLAFVVRLWLAARRSTAALFQRPANAALGLTFLQIALGATTVLTAKAVTPTTFHVATGAAVLGSCWFTTLRAYRQTRPAARLGHATAVVAGAISAA